MYIYTYICIYFFYSVSDLLFFAKKISVPATKLKNTNNLELFVKYTHIMYITLGFQNHHYHRLGGTLHERGFRHVFFGGMVLAPETILWMVLAPGKGGPQ